MSLPLVLALLGGCDPHDATFQGTYAMYFAAATSSNMQRLRRDETAVQCEYTQKDPLADDIDPEQIFADDCWAEKAKAEKAFQDAYDLTPFDCRTFGEPPYSDNPVRIRDALLPGWDGQYEDFCCVEAHDDDPDNDPDGDVLTPDDCTVQQARYLNFFDDKAFYLNQGDVVTWREEALITSEGDLQLTLHMNTKFGDVRFGWVIKPGFQPTECVDIDGVATERNVFDDGNWVDGWSASYEEDAGYSVYMLNAGATQVNPSNTGDYWYFDRTWLAGASFSRFADEDAYMYTSDYADYSAAGNAPLWVGVDDDGHTVSGYGVGDGYGSEQYPELNCGKDGDSCNTSDYADFVQLLKDNFNTGGVDNADVSYAPVQDELANYAGLSRDDFPFTIKIEDNSWRTTAAGEGTSAEGFDNWSSINPGWVRLKGTRAELEALEPGTLDAPLVGDFQVMFYSSDSSGSVWAMNGSFEISKIGEDVWGADTGLDELKRIENETPECGG
ncbi:MAG: hypothetical protein EXR71_15085 [Myxococcales bacterium]|nr:hypothetical protein [Myxococcales bacterium]